MRRLVSFLACFGLWAAPAPAKDDPRLELVREARCTDLFGDGHWEASGIEFDGTLLRVAFDNDWRVGVLDPSLDPESARLVEPVDPRQRGYSDLEGLAYDAQGRLWGCIEGARLPSGEVHGLLVPFDAEGRPLAPRPFPFALPDGGKGYEGLAAVERDGKVVLLALLEGNHGEGGKRGKDKGHGRIHAYVLDPESDALPEPQVLEIPETADFKDYAGIDVDGDRVVIVSQASSKVWVGELEPKSLTFKGKGQVYRMPLEGGAEKTTFDRVEGVVWLDARTLACVSDRAQPDESDAHDQAVHVFRLPAAE
ncbi:MAG: hypothetical protein R3F62_15045 [Planctomycetota bacterium]